MYATEFHYLQSSQNSQIFLVHYSPVEAAATNRAVILIPPFAEEMNRSKRMYVLCARLLANHGFDAICFDYSGTGDSQGNWGDYSYSDWLTNLQDVYKYVYKDIPNISVIALRFGALLAVDSIAKGDIEINQCVLWDPVDNGEALTRQLIRTKIATAMASQSKKITTQQVRDEIDQLGYLEVGGYHVPASLIDEIDGKKINQSIEPVLSRTHLHWMNLGKFNSDDAGKTKQPDLPLSLNQIHLTDILLEKLFLYSVNDVKFWMQQEVTISPQLLKETKGIFVNE